MIVDQIWCERGLPSRHGTNSRATPARPGIVLGYVVLMLLVLAGGLSLTRFDDALPAGPGSPLPHDTAAAV